MTKWFRGLVAPLFINGRAALGLLALRVMIGVAFVIHGYPKIEHATTWMNATGGAHAFPAWLQVIGAGVEFFGGLALVVGFASQLAAALICFNMFVATFVVELPSGAHFASGKSPFELPLVYFIATLALLFLGPGAISVDRWLGSALSRRGPDLHRATATAQRREHRASR
jgi:putative oxidoreductase